MTCPDATVLITTKNRQEDLRRALRSTVVQHGAVVEIIVIDDGSTDGTAALVHREFPTVRLERREKSRGLIVRRNEGARLATAPIVFSIDDDAEFSDSDAVARTLSDFDHPRVGAVAIPFINVQQGPRVLQRAVGADATVQITDTYIGTAHALRRDVFLTLGGYREHFVHQGEEGDFCLRLLAAGYVVRLGAAAPIYHYESPRRDTRRMDYYGRRNDVLFAFHNVPVSNFFTHLAGTLLNGLRTAIRTRNPGHMIGGLASGFWKGLRCWRTERRPIPRRIYKLQRLLKKGGSLPLTEVEKWLPPALPLTSSAEDEQR